MLDVQTSTSHQLWMIMSVIQYGKQIMFRSEHYCGLGTWKKKEFYPAKVRKSETQRAFQIVTVSPTGKKIFLSVPYKHIENQEFEISTENMWNLVPDFTIDIDTKENDSFFVWEEYMDREAIKQINLNRAKANDLLHANS